MEEEPIPLEQRLRELERVIRVLCVALVLAAGGMAIRIMWMTPKFKQIFKDMLGSEDRLPGLTKMVINLAASFPLVFYGSAVAFTIAGTVAAMRLPRYQWMVIYVGSLGALILIWIMMTRALYLPMVKIIQGVAGHP